jgi:hypothetical protein
MGRFDLAAVGNHRGWCCPVFSVRVAYGLLHRWVVLSPAAAEPGGNAWVAGSPGCCSYSGVTQRAERSPLSRCG